MKLRRVLWNAISLAAQWDSEQPQLQGPVACTYLRRKGSKMAISDAKPRWWVLGTPRTTTRLSGKQQHGHGKAHCGHHVSNTPQSRPWRASCRRRAQYARHSHD